MCNETDLDLEDLLGLRVAFYRVKRWPFKNWPISPSDYFFLGQVTDNMPIPNQSPIKNAIKVTSLDVSEYRYFGKIQDQDWHMLLEDPSGALVICGSTPPLDFDILS